LEIGVSEAFLIDDEHAVGRQVIDVDLERGGVHRHQHRRLVTRSEYRLAGEVQLKAADAGQGPGRGANLRWKIRQGRDVVAGQRGLGGKLHARQLHSVAGVAGEADYELRPGFNRLVAGRSRPLRKRLGRLRWYSHLDLLSSSNRTLKNGLVDGGPWEAPPGFCTSTANEVDHVTEI